MLNLKTQNSNLNQKTNLRYRTYQFSLNIINLLTQFPKERVFWTIGDQLLRSATSIGANIIEATGSSSKKDFINFYHIALKSANETEYWLSLLKDGHLIDSNKIDLLLREINEIFKMLGASILTMKNKR